MAPRGPAPPACALLPGGGAGPSWHLGRRWCWPSAPPALGMDGGSPRGRGLWIQEGGAPWGPSLTPAPSLAPQRGTRPWQEVGGRQVRTPAAPPETLQGQRGRPGPRPRASGALPCTSHLHAFNQTAVRVPVLGSVTHAVDTATPDAAVHGSSVLLAEPQGYNRALVAACEGGQPRHACVPEGLAAWSLRLQRLPFLAGDAPLQSAPLPRSP